MEYLLQIFCWIYSLHAYWGPSYFNGNSSIIFFYILNFLCKLLSFFFPIILILFNRFASDGRFPLIFIPRSVTLPLISVSSALILLNYAFIEDFRALFSEINSPKSSLVKGTVLSLFSNFCSVSPCSSHL